MKIFLAGGYSGNLRNYFDKLYADIPCRRTYGQERANGLARERESRRPCRYSLQERTERARYWQNDADILRRYAVTSVCHHRQTDRQTDRGLEGIYILESFYYCRSNPLFPKLLPLMGDFLLDSGAFTFMSGCKERVNWDAYVEEYAGFINTHKIEKFFELDIDSVVGLKEVERLRTKLEALTGKQSIPVWHLGRGKEYFERMIQEYKYVALGGIVSKEIPIQHYEKIFPWFIRTAHDAGVKIHGLGYTNCTSLRKFHFDSVDSTAWLYGNRGGYLYRFNPNKPAFFDKIVTPPGKRLVSVDAAKWNFNEWVKFQQYALKRL